MKIFLLVLVILLNLVVKAQTKEQILKYHFEKMGASEKWLSINTIKKESTVIYGSSLESSTNSKSIIYAKKSMFAKIESINKTNNSFIIIGADSLGYWRKINNGLLSRVSTKGSDFMQHDMTMFIASELKNTKNIELKPNKIFNGKEYYILDVKNENQRRIIYVNSKTYMIDAYIGIGVEDVSEISPITLLSDYRDVTGFLFPFQSEISMERKKIKTIVQSIQINIPIDNKIFSPEKE